MLTFRLVPDHYPQALVHRDVRPYPIEENEYFIFNTKYRFEVND